MRERSPSSVENVRGLSSELTFKFKCKFVHFGPFWGQKIGFCKGVKHSEAEGVKNYRGGCLSYFDIAAALFAV